MESPVLRLLVIVRRWWWVLILGPLIGGLVGFGVSGRAEPVYSSSVLLEVNRPHVADPADPDAGQSSEALAQTYRQVVGTGPVLQPVVEELALPYSVDVLKGKVTARNPDGTAFIDVTVSDADPQRAAGIANAIAQSFATHLADQSAQSGSQTRAAVDTRLSETSGQIEQLEQQITTLEQSPISEEATNQEQLSQMRTTLAQLERAHAEYSIMQQELDIDAVAAQSRIIVTTAAEPATSPDEPDSRLTLRSGSVAGLLVAAAVVVLGSLNATVRPVSDPASVVGAPVIGRIGYQPKLRKGEGQLFMLRHPKAETSESIRFLRANIEIASAADKITSLAITSPEVGEGKSTVIANLAIAMAQAGMRTVVIDADLRNPSQHRIFGIGNSLGLSSWLKQADRPLFDLASATTVRNLLLIPAGPASTSPADALSLNRVRQVLALIGDRADIILIDTSPVLDSSETLLVAAEVDGVILISRPDPGHPDALRLAATVLDPIGARIVGVVVNHQSRRRSMGSRDAALESGMAGSPMPGQRAIDDDDFILVDTSPAPFPLRVKRSLSRLKSTAS